MAFYPISGEALKTKGRAQYRAGGAQNRGVGTVLLCAPLDLSTA